MPKGSAVEDVESKLKSRYGSNDKAVYGTLNKIGLMHGNKPTAKGLKKAKHPQPPHKGKTSNEEVARVFGKSKKG